MLIEIGGIILVAILWGTTNPLIKSGTVSINRVQSNSKIMQFLLEIKYLLTNYKYIIPMAFNQIGSVMYFLLLQRVDISLAVPVANSLTFVFTALMGRYLSETPPKSGVFYGSALIVIGSSLLCYSKMINEAPIDRKEF